ncbi:hypothetical protein I6E85_17960 [Pseudoalteromonas sp. NZS71]|uniref:hypothetical protein n=1 Tax=Pseudoalteromonas sp. NZS71 TaxID=2792052 RepID=UPI0018CF5C43|nr:hypothetical protein [Pseudoalteromonas sp. NZS71]MBH0063019.1 hypothetical protein [Pseudoalteromonas sp. NZS71]
MPAEVISTTQYLPIVGTMIGGFIAFIAAFATSKFNKDKDELLARENRIRARIEKIYKLLIIIDKDITSDVGKIIKFLHAKTPYKLDDVPELPPLIELEMLINMYFPDMEIIRLDLLRSIQDLTVKIMSCQIQNYHHQAYDLRKVYSDEIFELKSKVNENIESFKKNLIVHVKV